MPVISGSNGTTLNIRWGFNANGYDAVITVGTTVKWNWNLDSSPHTVTSVMLSSGLPIFDSSVKGSGSTFSYLFTTAGTYDYYCSLHSGSMRAKITVVNAARRSAEIQTVSGLKLMSSSEIGIIESTASHQILISWGLSSLDLKTHIKVGDQVTWVLNQDSQVHTVTASKIRGQSGAPYFDSGLLTAGVSFSFTFSEAGLYYFYCRLRSEMTGIIVVSE